MSHPFGRQIRQYVSAILVRQDVIAGLGVALHDAWQQPRDFVSPGVREPRWKPTKDTEWIAAWNDRLKAEFEARGAYVPFRMNGTTAECDIANLPFVNPSEKFGGLPKEPRRANELAAENVLQLVMDRFISGESLDENWLQQTAAHVHNFWVGENYEWAEPGQLVGFESLTTDEKDKDLAIVNLAVDATRQLFRQLWADAFKAQNRSDAGEAARQLGTRFHTDKVASAEVLASVASAVQSKWRDLLPPRQQVWQRTTDVVCCGRLESSKPTLVRMSDAGELLVDIAQLDHEEFPEDLRRQNEEAAASMLAKIWHHLADGQVIDEAFRERMAREEHEEYLARLARDGREPRRPEVKRRWEELNPADQELNRALVACATDAVEDFLREVEAFRIGDVDLTRLADLQVSVALAAGLTG